MSVRLDHGEDTLNEVHEINVTPFIDVMLVLLIRVMNLLRKVGYLKVSLVALEKVSAP